MIKAGCTEQAEDIADEKKTPAIAGRRFSVCGFGLHFSQQRL